MADVQLERDHKGNIKLHPVTGYITGTLAGISVLLVIEYSETQKEPEKLKQIQFALSAQEALHLAEALTKKANAVLTPPQGGVH